MTDIIKTAFLCFCVSIDVLVLDSVVFWFSVLNVSIRVDDLDDTLHIFQVSQGQESSLSLKSFLLGQQFFGLY